MKTVLFSRGREQPDTQVTGNIRASGRMETSSCLLVGGLEERSSEFSGRWLRWAFSQGKIRETQEHVWAVNCRQLSL